MRGVFVDANESLAVIFERLQKSSDPIVRINRDPDIKPDQLPQVLDGAEIAIVDHTPLPTDIAQKCASLKHVVFLGTGARSYMNPEELAEFGISVHLIKGYGGALVREKIVAAASRRLVILVGREKLVPVLGSRGKLPRSWAYTCRSDRLPMDRARRNPAYTS